MITDPTPDIKQCTIARLRELHANHKHAIDQLKAGIDQIESELMDRLGAQFAKELSDSGRQHGDVSQEVSGIKLTYSVKNKVEWDQDSLKAIAATMPWSTVERVFKIDFSVPEKTFKALTDDMLIDKLTKARTVKYSDPKITFAK